MADDWDLNAVVRSCKSTTTANKTTSLVSDEEFSLDSLTLLQDQYFSSPNNHNNNMNHYEPTNTINDAFQELQQFFSKPTFPDHHHNPTDSSNNNSIYILNSLSVSPDHDHLGASRPSTGQLQHQMQDQNGVVFSPQPQQEQRADHGEAQKKSNNISRPVLLPRPLPPGYDASAPDPNLLLLSTIPTRPRKFRKNQQKKMVCTVTKENVHSDLWSWRKYGQKPIKGSPYPRNYYRCSGMKGCSARKQIERSRLNPELFVLTYTGEHRHCRPNHRNSLSGTTRSSKPLIPPPPPPTALPSPPPQSAESAAANIDVNVESEKGAQEDDLLIPNVVFSEDFFNDILI